eukprot:m51a1_g1477 hypothetical protein (95) ;mRNA; r:270954-271238
MRVSAVVVVAVVLLLSSANAWDCWEAWSRCTGWSAPATGILWQDCNTHCQGCFNAAGGTCRISGQTTCMGFHIDAYQCQCYGRWSGDDQPDCGT